MGMETEIGLPCSNSNSSGGGYKKMGKGSDLSKIICNLHMKVMGKVVNEDVGMKPSDSINSGGDPRNEIMTNNRMNRHPNIVTAPEILKANDSHLNESDMDIPINLTVKVKSATEPDTETVNNMYNDILKESKSKTVNECLVCNKSFSSCYSLQRHMRGVHRGEKPHACPVCQKSFTQQSHLKKHFQTHIEDIVVTPLIFIPPSEEEDPESTKSPFNKNATSNNPDEKEDEDDTLNQRKYVECENCHRSFNSINNFKCHRRICHLVRNKNNMENHINRNFKNKKKKKRRVHETFFVTSRLRNCRKRLKMSSKRSSEFNCLVRGCFSNCSSYRMYMEHVYTHSTKFRLSKSRVKNKLKFIGTEDDGSDGIGIEATATILESVPMEMDLQTSNNHFITTPKIDVTAEEEDTFVPLSGFGGLFDYGIEAVQQFPVQEIAAATTTTTTLVPWLSSSNTESNNHETTTSLADSEKSSVFTCQSCGKQFNRKFSFDRHILIHLGHRPFSCQVCGFQFTQASHLKKHERKHVNENASTVSQNTSNESATNTSLSPPTTTTTTTTNTTSTTVATTDNNCKVPPTEEVKDEPKSKPKVKTPEILRIPLRPPIIEDPQKVLQANENINENSNGVTRRRSSRRRY